MRRRSARSGGREARDALPAHALESLATKGVVILPGPFASNRIAQLQAAYDATVATAAPEDIRVGRTSTRVNGFVERDPIFECLYTWPPALEAAQRVVGARFRLSAFHARTLHSGAPAQDLHVDVPRTSDAWPMLGLILMVDEFRADNGATRFIPGSHRRAELPADVLANLSANHPDEFLACGPAGSVILFDASTWHGHTGNSSASPRRSLQATFIPHTGHPATDFGARMRREDVARLSHAAREVLGLIARLAAIACGLRARSRTAFIGSFGHGLVASFRRGNMHSISRMARLTAAGVLLMAGVASAQATKAQAAVAAAMRGAKHVALADAIETASASGKPISARYEFEDGKLKLSVFIDKAGAYTELFFDHVTGKVAQSDKLTGGDDLKEAKAESKVLAKAKGSLAAAVTKALAANPGYTAVDVTPVLEGKAPVAEITLMKDGRFKGVSEPIG